MRPADKAWLALCGGIIAYEALALEGELLSEAYDRYLIGPKRLLAMAAPWLLAAHLTNTIPTHLDPIHGLFVFVSRLRNRA